MSKSSNYEGFSRLIQFINQIGLYNPRNQDVSNQLCYEMIADLYYSCDVFRKDVTNNVVCYRPNTRLVSKGQGHTVDLVLGLLNEKEWEGKRERKGDLHIWKQKGKSPITRLKANDRGFIINPNETCIIRHAVNVKEFDEILLIVENKSLMTAHRNVFNRTRILRDLGTSLAASSYNDAIRVATWLQGTALAYVNPDMLKWAIDAVSALCEHNPTKLKSACKIMNDELHRIEASLGHAKSYNSATLKIGSELYEMLVSKNKPNEPQKTMKDVIGAVGEPRTDDGGYDALIFQFVFIDNILKAKLDEPDYFKGSKYSGVKYQNVMDVICKKYKKLRL